MTYPPPLHPFPHPTKFDILYVHFLDRVYTFIEQSNFHKIKLREVDFDSWR